MLTLPAKVQTNILYMSALSSSYYFSYLFLPIVISFLFHLGMISLFLIGVSCTSIFLLRFLSLDSASLSRPLQPLLFFSLSLYPLPRPPILGDSPSPHLYLLPLLSLLLFS